MYHRINFLKSTDFFLPSNVVIARDLQSDMSGLVPCHTGPAGVSAQYQRASPLAPMGQGCSAT